MRSMSSLTPLPMNTSSAVTPRDAARLLLHDHRLARREDALLVAVAFRLGQVLDHRQAHGLGRAQAEGARVADVQRDDLVALALELVGAPCQASADLVAHVLQALARADGRLAHEPKNSSCAGRSTLAAGADELRRASGRSAAAPPAVAGHALARTDLLPGRYALGAQRQRVAGSACGRRSRSAAAAARAAPRRARRVRRSRLHLRIGARHRGATARCV